MSDVSQRVLSTGNLISDPTAPQRIIALRYQTAASFTLSHIITHTHTHTRTHVIHMHTRARTKLFMQWLKEDFLSYLKEWQTSIEQRKGFTKAQKQTMCLSKETLLGLRMTGVLYISYMHIFGITLYSKCL